jgi:hypothetical protein
MGLALSKDDDLMDHFHGLGLRELSLNGEFSTLPEEIVLHIFSFCDVRSVVDAGTLCRRLRKIASDETIWKNVYKNKYGSCRLREGRGGRFDWRREFMNRQCSLLERKRVRADARTAGTNVSVASQIWGTLWSSLNPFTPIRKRKVVFVGLEAAGKVPIAGPLKQVHELFSRLFTQTTCCFRLQTNGPDPNYFPIPRRA